ncbi:MAG: hypothetical protein ACLR3C_10780 [Eggerthella lenta]
MITQMIQAGVMLWWFVKREKTARIVRVAVSPAILPEVLKVGASAMLMQVLVLVQQAIAYRAAAAWGGAEWQVLLGAALRIQAFAFIPLWGMSNGLQPAAGTNYGAGLYGRVRKLTIVFCLGSMALALLFWVPRCWRRKPRCRCSSPTRPSLRWAPTISGCSSPPTWLQAPWSWASRSCKRSDKAARRRSSRSRDPWLCSSHSC